MYLFDTDIISNIFKKKPSLLLIDRLKIVPHESQFISTITVGEIVYGAFKSNNPEYHLNNLKNILLPVINILAFDSKSSYIYGKIRAALERSGNILNHTDIQIASIAISNELILITGNTKHFIRIENLKIENWL